VRRGTLSEGMINDGSSGTCSIAKCTPSRLSLSMDDSPSNGAEPVKALERALIGLRQQLDDVTAALRLSPGNTRLVIERVNVMKRIMLAQTEIDRRRADIANN
jgi:hypothetical protein